MKGYVIDQQTTGERQGSEKLPGCVRGCIKWNYKMLFIWRFILVMDLNQEPLMKIVSINDPWLKRAPSVAARQSEDSERKPRKGSIGGV